MTLSQMIYRTEGLLGKVTYSSWVQDHVKSGDILIWYRNNETTGTTIIDYGSLKLNGTASNCTLAQPGQLGAGEALLPAANGKVSRNVSAGFSALQSFEWVFLVQMPAAYVSTYLLAFGDVAHYVQLFGTTGALRMVVDCATTDATAITTTAVKPALNVWSLIFASYDATTGRARVRIGNGGAVTDCAYSTDTQGVGTVQTMSSALTLWNRASADAGFASPADDFQLWVRVMTDAERLQLTLLAGA